MQQARWQAGTHGTRWQQRATLVAAIACTIIATPAQAQGSKLGTYSGTVVVSGTEIGKFSKTTYSARIEITLPLTTGDARSAMAEIGDVDKPSAKGTITQWDLEARNSGPDSDGKITSWTCKLAAAVTVPMNASGVLNVDFSAKKYSMFVALAGLKPIALNCVNSRSGAYKDSKAVGLAFGTNPPDVLPYKELPFADPMRLAAKYTLEPIGAMKGRAGPLVQEWDFKLTR
jgi:hypothetical protein